MNSKTENSEPEIWQYREPQFERQYKSIGPEPHMPGGMLFSGTMILSGLLFLNFIGFMEVYSNAYPWMKRYEIEGHIEKYPLIPHSLRPLAKLGMEIGYTMCLDK